MSVTLKRALWFIGLWLAGVVVIGMVAFGLRLVLLP